MERTPQLKQPIIDSMPKHCLASWCLIALAVGIAPTPANAEGSCGTGGATGELNESWAPSEYYLYVPSSAGPDNPLPLVVTLHGDEGDPAMSTLYWWPPIWRETMDFILLVPRNLA